MLSNQKNVFGLPLQDCSCNPLTGYYRNGTCSTDEHDEGVHTICAIMSEEFLTFSRSRGNNLSMPQVQFGFPGLKPGDRWCLCASRWLEAWREGLAPLVVLEATNERTLDLIPIELLLPFAYRAATEDAKL